MKIFTFRLLKTIAVLIIGLFAGQWLIEVGYKIVFYGVSFADANKGFKFNGAVFVPIATSLAYMMQKRESKSE